MHDVLADVLAASAAAALFQTMAAPRQYVRRVYSGPTLSHKVLIEYWIRISKENGALGLWRGNGKALVHYVPSVALTFAVWGRLRDPGGSIAHNFAAGAAAGAASVLSQLLFDEARWRVAQFPRRCETVEDAVRLRGPHPSARVSLLMAASFRGVFFGGYEALRSDDSPLWQRWLAAQAAVAAASVVSHPLVVVQAHMSTSPTAETAWSVAKRMLREEGAATFYKGCGPSLIRGVKLFPTLVVFEEVRACLV